MATTNSDQLALVNAYNGWMHSQYTKAYADSHCLHMASLSMIKGLFLSVFAFMFIFTSCVFVILCDVSRVLFCYLYHLVVI